MKSRKVSGGMELTASIVTPVPPANVAKNPVLLMYLSVQVKPLTESPAGIGMSRIILAAVSVVSVKLAVGPVRSRYFMADGARNGTITPTVEVTGYGSVSGYGGMRKLSTAVKVTVVLLVCVTTRF